MQECRVGTGWKRMGAVVQVCHIYVVVSMVQYLSLCYFGLIMWLGVVDDGWWQSCGSMAGSAWCCFSWLLVLVSARGIAWTSAPVRSTTEERWPQDAEDLSHCLSQEQSLQRKEEEDIRQCLKKYQCTDDCACIGSIHLLYPSIHASLDACMHPVGKGQANR